MKRVVLPMSMPTPVTGPGNPAYAIRRSELALAQYGIVRDGEIWVVPDSCPKLVIEMVEAVCTDRNHDWRYVSDV